MSALETLGCTLKLICKYTAGIGAGRKGRGGLTAQPGAQKVKVPARQCHSAACGMLMSACGAELPASLLLVSVGYDCLDVPLSDAPHLTSSPCFACCCRRMCAGGPPVGISVAALALNARRHSCARLLQPPQQPTRTPLLPRKSRMRHKGWRRAWRRRTLCKLSRCATSGVAPGFSRLRSPLLSRPAPLLQRRGGAPLSARAAATCLATRCISAHAALRVRRRACCPLSAVTSA